MLELRALRASSADGVQGSTLGGIAKALVMGENRLMNQLVMEVDDKSLGELRECLSQAGQGKKVLEVTASCVGFMFPEFRVVEEEAQKFKNQQQAVQGAWLYYFARLYMNSNGIMCLDNFRQMVENEVEERDTKERLAAMAAAEQDAEEAVRRQVISDLRRRSWLARFLDIGDS